jgi:hypothetical protein
VEIVRWSSGGWDGYICGVNANNFALETDAAYFVRHAGAGLWKIGGTEIEVRTTPSFQSGWNGVNATAWGKNAAADLCAAIPAPDRGVEVNRWHASGWEGHICDLGFNNFTTAASNGYFLKVAGDSRAVERTGPASPLAVPIETEPVSDLRITNLRDGSVAISWQTESLATSRVTYSVDGQIRGIGHDVRGEEVEDRVHYVILPDLVPKTTYTFSVDSPHQDGKHSHGEGLFTTFSTFAAIPRSQSAYGRVLLNDGQTPAAGMLIFLRVQDANGQGSAGESLLLSTLTDSNGWWYANFGNARTQNGDPFQFEGEDQVEIRVARADHPMTTLTIPVSTSFPATAIQLADNHIFVPLVLR